MLWRPFGLLVLVVALLTAACGGGSATPTSARYGCFRFQVVQTQPTAGSVLAVDVVATNVTSVPCSGRSCGGITGGFVITNADGRAVKHDGPAGVTCRSDAPPPEQVAPGASVVWASLRWDGLGDLTGPRCVPGDCRLTRPRLKAGRYRVTWSWLDAVRVRSPWLKAA